MALTQLGGDNVSPTARWLIGLGALALGLIPFLGVVEMPAPQPGDVELPRWVGMVAGALVCVVGLMFLLGGWLGKRGGYVLIVLFMAGFVVIFNFLAFGPGDRTCDDGSTGIGCRLAFAMGALMMDVALLLMLGWGLKLLRSERQHR